MTDKKDDKTVGSEFPSQEDEECSERPNPALKVRTKIINTKLERFVRQSDEENSEK